MSDQLVNKLILTLSGTSHSDEIKLTVTGLPQGIAIDRELINLKLAYRRGEDTISTPRREMDEYYLWGGLSDDITNGKPLTIIVKNKSYNDEPYEHPEIVRPGHADLVQYLKYDGEVDLRGGGICSGRMTVAFVILGAICETALKNQNITLASYIMQIGSIKSETKITPTVELLNKLNTSFPALDKSEEMKQAILDAKTSGDSLGGITQTCCLGLPVGLGDAFFNKLNSQLARLILTIPGANGISFGEGFNATNLLGSEYNDVPYFDDDHLKYTTNHSGGLSGGMTNGNPLIFNTSFRPASSISKLQKTVNLQQKTNTTIQINGMHDSCFVHRAVHVVNAMTAIIIFEALLERKRRASLNDYRNKIDMIDNQIINLLNERFLITEQIGKYKNQLNLPTYDAKREAVTLNKANNSPYHAYIKGVYERILTESKDQQAKYMLAAGNINYSYSKILHQMLGNKEYAMHEIKDLGLYLAHNAPLGINVTNPLKREAYFLCEERDEWAEKSGVVNLMVKVGDHYQGYNSDVIALDNMLKYYGISLKNKHVLILGNGSSSQTAKILAAYRGAKSINSLVRHIKGPNELLFSDATKNELCDIIINTTTFGVYPNLENESLIDFTLYPNLQALIDLNYNPNLNGLLQSAIKNGIPCYNGLYMLIENARISESLWQNQEISEDITPILLAKVLKETSNIILVGQSLSGKSTTGCLLSEALHKDLFDSDAELAKRHQSLEETKDLTKFRLDEALILTDATLLKNSVIVPGAGFIENKDVVSFLKQNGVVVFLDTPLEVLINRAKINKRPLLNNEQDVISLYKLRQNVYQSISDITIKTNDKTLQQIIQEMMVKLNEYYDHQWTKSQPIRH